MSVQVDLQGFDALEARLGMVAATTQADLRQALDASLLLIESGYKRNLEPYRLTGRSLRSVTSRVQQTSILGVSALEGTVGSSAAWGRAFELGRPAGIWPPLGPLVAWVRGRKLSGVYSLKSATHRRLGSKATRADQDLQAARGIQRAIFRRGIKPHPALIPAYEQALPRIRALFERVGVALVSRIEKGS